MMGPSVEDDGSRGNYGRNVRKTMKWEEDDGRNMRGSYHEYKRSFGGFVHDMQNEGSVG